MAFTCCYQYAQHEIHQTDNKGTITAAQFQEVFDGFPWRDQIAAANRLKKCSPTISIMNNVGDVLWVSAYFDNDEIDYLVSLEHTSEPSVQFFGSGAKGGLQTTTKEPSEVKALFARFFADDADTLKRELAKLDGATGKSKSALHIPVSEPQRIMAIVLAVIGGLVTGCITFVALLTTIQNGDSTDAIPGFIFFFALFIGCIYVLFRAMAERRAPHKQKKAHKGTKLEKTPSPLRGEGWGEGDQRIE